MTPRWRSEHTESNRWLIGTIVLGAQQAVEEVEQTEAESGWEFGIDLPAK